VNGLRVNKENKICLHRGNSKKLTFNNSFVIKNTENCNYLGITSTLDKDGEMEKEIQNRITQGRKPISLLNGILWMRIYTRAR
jgi:hypothetical protein